MDKYPPEWHRLVIRAHDGRELPLDTAIGRDLDTIGAQLLCPRYATAFKREDMAPVAWEPDESYRRRLMGVVGQCAQGVRKARPVEAAEERALGSDLDRMAQVMGVVRSLGEKDNELRARMLGVMRGMDYEGVFTPPANHLQFTFQISNPREDEFREKLAAWVRENWGGERWR